MKPLQTILLGILAILNANTYGMRFDKPFTHAEVKTYFIPQEQEQMRNELFQALDSARKQVLVAVYWITDQSIIDKLIETRRKRVDIKIIFDESSDNSQQVLNTFLQNNVPSLLYPSIGIGKMHNKFLVIDDEITFTGSLNLTKTACDPNCSVFNLENVLILRSPEIARKYAENFSEIEKQSFDLYIQLISELQQDEIPEWLANLAPTLYAQNNTFKNMVQSSLRRNSRIEQERIQDFFGFAQKRTRVEPPTEKQKRILKDRGMYSENMSRKEASALIGKIFAEDKKRKWQQSK